MEDDFSHELQVLSMPHRLRHPNIIELYTTFVKGCDFSLRMPVAECDSGKLLNGHALTVPGLMADTEICFAL